MYRLSFSFLLMFKVIEDFGSFPSATLTREFMFTQADPSILSVSDFRVAPFSWIHVSGAVSCAQNTISSCPDSRGFLYDTNSGLCTSLIWLHLGSSAASNTIPAGQLYLTTDLCPNGFKGVEYGTDKHLTCVMIISPATTYDLATSLCADLGGNLASVKTVDKLAMVVSLAQGSNLWIGLDDQVTEGVYVWQQDFSHLTSTQINDTFTEGEPNNGWNVEDCVHFRGNKGRLNDQHCWDTMLGLCETLPVESTC